VLQADLGAQAVDAKLAAQLVAVVGRTAPDMIPQAVATTLYALGKLEAAEAAMLPSGWAALAKAAERTAPDMNEQGVSNALPALARLPAAAAKLSTLARERLEAAAEREAPNMTSEGRKGTARACEKLGLKIPSMLRDFLI